MEKKHLNIQEASIYSGLSTSYLYKKSAQRDLPMLKCGSKVLIPKLEFDKWLDSKRVDIKKRSPINDGREHT